MALRFLELQKWHYLLLLDLHLLENLELLLDLEVLEHLLVLVLPEDLMFLEHQ